MSRSRSKSYQSNSGKQTTSSLRKRLPSSPSRQSPPKQMPSGEAKQDNTSGIKPKVQYVTISEKNQFQRIDNFLFVHLKGLPKSKVYNLIRKGEIRINKKRCKPETKLALDDVVRIAPVYGLEGSKAPMRASSSLLAYLDSAILYEDELLLVVNKPSGLAVHGGSGVKVGLIEVLRQRYPETQFLELVHRIDRDTSGCIMVAKKRSALRHFHAQFRQGDVDKVYHLAVHGQWPANKKRVDAALKREELKSGERFVIVHPDGKPSRTYFKVLSKSDHFTLLEAKPISGRTHQIRVHAVHSGCPIVGDEKYIHRDPINENGMSKSRLMLHAKSVAITLPSGDKVCFESPYDEVFTENLRKMSLERDCPESNC
ncbi:MAG: RluA family pseudouridine synthase [Oleiphilus sp.]